MFLDFYGLREQPFGVTPDPRYLYLSPSHREALASLFYGIKAGRGILALVAQPGMGKTTLLSRFLEHLRRSARTAYLFQTQCDSAGLMRCLLTALGIDADGQEFVTMHERFSELLMREASSRRKVVLVIDEAQNLDNRVLETARLLSDFETPREKLVQIVLAGQTQLAEKLEQRELAQLRQRIDIVGRLEPFKASEVADYIEHRLRVAGYSGGRLFQVAAVEKIAHWSRGIPRNINNLCFNALSLGRAYHRRQIDSDLVREVVCDLDIETLANQRHREPLPVVQLAEAAPAIASRLRDTPQAVFPAPGLKHRFGRMAVITSILGLALLASVFDWGGLKAATARSRRAMAGAVARLASHPADSPAVSGVSAGLSPEDLADATNSGASAPSVLGGVRVALDPNRTDPEPSLGLEHTERTITVVVRLNDDLRRICLQYLGSYSAELQSEISKLNPALNDLDHIEVGQPLVLPRPLGEKSNISQPTPGVRP